MESSTFFTVGRWYWGSSMMKGATSPEKARNFFRIMQDKMMANSPRK